MRKLLFMLVIISLLVIQISCSSISKPSTLGSSPTQPSTSSQQTSELTELAKRFVTDLEKGNYKSAVSGFDSTMNAQISEQKLQEIWQSLVAQSGKFVKQTGTRTEKAQQYDVVYVTCEFEKSTLDTKVVFNSSRQVSGLFFVPSAPAANQPPQINESIPDNVQENPITVGTGQWVLPGTLTLPKSGELFPVVILVHGSGPNDRDETIGSSKPFRDIAWGLASKGIAVLRYDKRTYVYAEKLAGIKEGLTVKDETIDDAVAAVALMQSTKEIDRSRIFVLGHSLGGNQIPRIGLLTPAAAGFIIMAGSVRPLEDLILEQSEYIMSLDKTMDAQKKDEQLTQIRAQVANIKAPDLPVSRPAQDLLGVPASYWLDLRGYNSAETARQLKQPMLIMQGERDYQVTSKDFVLWKNSLSSQSNVATFKSYPDLNHLFITGMAKSTPQEYNNPGHVAEEVIDDIANWVKQQ